MSPVRPSKCAHIVSKYLCDDVKEDPDAKDGAARFSKVVTPPEVTLVEYTTPLWSSDAMRCAARSIADVFLFLFFERDLFVFLFICFLFGTWPMREGGQRTTMRSDLHPPGGCYPQAQAPTEKEKLLGLGPQIAVRPDELHPGVLQEAAHLAPELAPEVA